MIERRRRAGIAASDIYPDPVRSIHCHFVKANRLRWLLPATKYSPKNKCVFGSE
jgi:hypothetical protein